MLGKTARIPFAQIEKIEIYVNEGKKKIEEIKSETGCDYIINAGLYNMAGFQPVNMLTVRGKALSAGGNPFGFGFDGPNVSFDYGNSRNSPYFIGAYPVLIRNGKKDYKTVPAGLSGYRGRSAVGTTPDSLILRCVPDLTGTEDFTLDQLTAELLAEGCTHAINLDGGGSSQCDFKGERVQSPRRVHNYICVWTKHSSGRPQETEKTEGGKTEKKGEWNMIKVCIDPGHGGGDPGAVSGGVQEKALTLSIGKKVTEYLKQTGISVTATRAADKGLSLTERCNISNAAGADAFVSVHINSAASAAANGIETWYSKTSTKGPRLAQAIQHSVIGAVGGADRGIKGGKFTVLTGTKAPAALIECGFIVNEKDRGNLLKEEYQDCLAEAIASGICQWLGVPFNVGNGGETVKPPQENSNETPRHWAEDALDTLAEKGIISEPEKHRPTLEGTFTKGEVCAMLAKLVR